MSQTDPQSQAREPASAKGRRRFLVRAAAAILGALAALVPIASGLLVFLGPLRRQKREGRFVRVAPLDAVPADGVPRRFPIIAERTDAWNHYPAEPIGAVYLSRTSDGLLLALNVACPHAGCFVVYDSAGAQFRCPCHSSMFDVDGTRSDPIEAPAPRSLDSLACEIRAEGSGKEIWVKFQNFRAGNSKKLPV